MTIHIINGPNLNLLGKREPDVYGNQSFESYFEQLQKEFKTVNLSHYQSNVEGELINDLQKHGFSADGIIINAGGYTHTSVAIADAIAAIKTPVVEVHISNVFAREEYRHHSMISGKCVGSISGFGLYSYSLAILALLNRKR